MDYILENEGNPVPDPTAATSTSSSSGGDNMDVDNEDEDDLAALKAVYGPSATSSSGGADPKARPYLHSTT
jgi:UBX domain-containing protein 1/4